MIMVLGDAKYKSFYIQNSKKGFLTKHKTWMSYPKIDIGWWNSYEEAEAFLQQYLHGLSEEEFAEYVRERILE